MADSKQLWFHTRLSGKVYPAQCCLVGYLRLRAVNDTRCAVFPSSKFSLVKGLY